MAQTNALTGSHIAAFKGIELHKNLSIIVDSRGPRVVTHEFPLRDGARIETLGRRPHQTDWTITFVGPTWKDDFLRLAASIDDSPSGLLVHPIYGQMQVVCRGFDRATINLVDATDTITVPLSFIEDQVDLGLDQQQTVASVKQNTDASIASFLAAAAPYAALATTAATSAFSASASTFSAAALSSVSDLTADASLPAQLDALSSQLSTVELALQADPLALESVAQVSDALDAAELVVSNCLQLAEQISLVTVSYVREVVQGRTSIAVLAQRRYGNDAINKIDLILTLNPKITDPTNIPAGSIVFMPV